MSINAQSYRISGNITVGDLYKYSWCNNPTGQWLILPITYKYDGRQYETVFGYHIVTKELIPIRSYDDITPKVDKVIRRQLHDILRSLS